jgi:Tol biopolymer transport system component
MNIDGTARETLVSNVKGYYASYSRDGSTIVYVSGNPNNYKQKDTICFLSPTSRTQSRLTNSLSTANPQFSFDDKKVYFLAGNSGVGYSLRSVKIDGSDSHDCIPTNVIHFDCSPVDEKIVVENLAGDGEDHEVSIVNSEGLILNRLMYIDYPCLGYIGNSAPRFSPDGATVVFSRLVFDSSNGSRSWIYKASVDGRTLVKLAEGDKASFSQDGSKIVYRHNLGITWSVCVINTDGTNSQKLFNISNGGIGDLSFSPDGTRIVFTIYKNCIVF